MEVGVVLLYWNNREWPGLLYLSMSPSLCHCLQRERMFRFSAQFQLHIASSLSFQLTVFQYKQD